MKRIREVSLIALYGRVEGHKQKDPRDNEWSLNFVDKDIYIYLLEGFNETSKV